MRLSLKEVPVSSGHEVLFKVDDNSALIVSDPRGIVGQQLRPHLLNTIIISITY
jgi:hypothetical protein